MKILIAYSSKNGTSYTCAKMLSQKLASSLEFDLVDLAKDTPDPSEYDIAVVGGAIRMERLDKKVRAFLKTNIATLSSMPSALYILCGFSENFDEYASTEPPRGLTLSLGIHHFGGELKPEKLHGFDKIAVWLMRNSIKSRELGEKCTEVYSLPEIIPENIALLAEKIRDVAFKS